MNRCKWCNINNPKYIDYHDNEWGKLKTDDNYLFEMLILETFQIGLSWECVLNKREAFKKAYNNFDLDKVCNYNDNKIKELESNPNIIRNKSKIKASINNAKIFKSIKEEYHSFYNYLKTFTLYYKFCSNRPFSFLTIIIYRWLSRIIGYKTTSLNDHFILAFY